MKIYIAGPMTGLPEFNYPAFFEAEKQLLDAGYEPLNPARVDELFPRLDNEPPRNWTWYMRKCIPMVCEAEGIAALRGWQRSRGAVFEIQSLGAMLDLPLASVETWVARKKTMQKELTGEQTN